MTLKQEKHDLIELVKQLHKSNKQTEKALDRGIEAVDQARKEIKSLRE
jgi:hypothetical protein